MRASLSVALIVFFGAAVAAVSAKAAASVAEASPGRAASAKAAVSLAEASRRRANPASDSLLGRAFDAEYSLDHKEAVDLFRRAIAADPKDSAAYRGLAAATWFNLVFLRGAVTVDHYLGGVRRPKIDLKRPPPELAAIFHDNLDRALQLAEQRERINSRDIDARYDVGAAMGLLASYTATVDGQVMAAFNAARRAYAEHEEVLKLDPKRQSAALVVGTYRYVVSTLGTTARWMAYLAGFGGGRERGLQMIEQAAADEGEAQTDARFALVILYNRERRYNDALRVLEQLQRRYPRNRLLWLEAGATALRAGRPADAERWLDEGIARLERDARARMFGEESLWFYKRGAARVVLRKTESARADLEHALSGDVQEWIRARTHVELGKLASVAGNRPAARAEYDRALEIFKNANDPAGERDARTLRASLPVR
jgi:tetratricopeptide (TPR) repeat protein